MFDVLGSSTSTKKSQSQPLQNQQNKPQLEIKKPQNSQYLANTKPQTPAQPKIQKSSKSYSVNNNMTEGESEYGIIISDIKNCKALETTELSKHAKLEITISEPNKVDGGFFQKIMLHIGLQHYQLLIKFVEDIVTFLGYVQLFKLIFPLV